MKNLHFALLGTVIMLSAIAVASCSFDEYHSEEQLVISDVPEDESSEETPGTKDPSPTDPSDGGHEDSHDPLEPEVPEDKEPNDPLESEVPEDKEPNDPPEPEVPDEKEPNDPLESEVPEDKEPNDPPEPEIPEDKESNDPPELEVPEEKEPNDPSEPEVPEDKEPNDPPEPEVPDEQEKPDETSKPVSGMPAMLINEFRTEFRTATIVSESRAEFIELKMLSAGNIGGLRVFIASNRQDSLVYEFPPVEVKKDERVVLHLRTLDDSSVNEYGDDLSESGGRDASPTARDFWLPGSNERLRKTDVIYIMDQDNQILDAVMFAEDTIPRNSVAFFNQAAEFLFSHGAWMSVDGKAPRHEDAVKSSRIGTALTRSISRDETVPDTNTAADWYITADHGATPGNENNPRRLD